MSISAALHSDGPTDSAARACNSGNWQWLSCVAFYSQFYRCYSPIAFPKKTDNNGDFVRHYVPELASFDKKYIYEPWKAPIADQKKWGCLIKGDGGASWGASWGAPRISGLDAPIDKIDGHALYPKPMFDFSERREVCIQGLKNAYAVGLRGNDKRVLDGTWRELFADSAEGPTQGKSGPTGAMLGDDDQVDDEDAPGAGNEDEDKAEAAPKRGTKHKRSDSDGKLQQTLHAHFKQAKR